MLDLLTSLYRRLEDELLFPAVRAHTGRHDAELERQRQQDHLLDLLLVELGGMVPTDRYFDAKVQVLMQVFGQHLHDAEALLGPELRRLLDAGERDSWAGGCWNGSINLKADHGHAGSRWLLISSSVTWLAPGEWRYYFRPPTRTPPDRSEPAARSDRLTNSG